MTDDSQWLKEELPVTKEITCARQVWSVVLTLFLQLRAKRLVV